MMTLKARLAILLVVAAALIVAALLYVGRGDEPFAGTLERTVEREDSVDIEASVMLEGVDVVEEAEYANRPRDLYDISPLLIRPEVFKQLYGDYLSYTSDTLFELGRNGDVVAVAALVNEHRYYLDHDELEELFYLGGGFAALAVEVIERTNEHGQKLRSSSLRLLGISNALTADILGYPNMDRLLDLIPNDFETLSPGELGAIQDEVWSNIQRYLAYRQLNGLPIEAVGEVKVPLELNAINDFVRSEILSRGVQITGSRRG